MHVQSMGVLILIGIVPLLVCSIVFLNVFRARSISKQITEIQVRGNVIANRIVSTGYFTSEDTSEVDEELARVSDSYGGRILIADSRLRVVRDTYGLEQDGIVVLPDAVRCLRGTTTKVVRQHAKSVEIYLSVISADRQSVYGVVVMNFSFQSVLSLYDHMKTIMFSVLLMLSVMIVAVSWILSRRLVRPLSRVVESIDHIGAGDFSEKMEVVDRKSVV